MTGSDCSAVLVPYYYLLVVVVSSSICASDPEVIIALRPGSPRYPVLHTPPRVFGDFSESGCRRDLPFNGGAAPVWFPRHFLPFQLRSIAPTPFPSTGFISKFHDLLASTVNSIDCAIASERIGRRFPEKKKRKKEDRDHPRLRSRIPNLASREKTHSRDIEPTWLAMANRADREMLRRPLFRTFWF